MLGDDTCAHVRPPIDRCKGRAFACARARCAGPYLLLPLLAHEGIGLVEEFLVEFACGARAALRWAEWWPHFCVQAVSLQTAARGFETD